MTRMGHKHVFHPIKCLRSHDDQACFLAFFTR